MYDDPFLRNVPMVGPKGKKPVSNLPKSAPKKRVNAPKHKVVK